MPPNINGRPMTEAIKRKERIEELMAERKKFYAHACDLLVVSSGKSPAELAERILYENQQFRLLGAKAILAWAKIGHIKR